MIYIKEKKKKINWYTWKLFVWCAHWIFEKLYAFGADLQLDIFGKTSIRICWWPVVPKKAIWPELSGYLYQICKYENDLGLLVKNTILFGKAWVIGDRSIVDRDLFSAIEIAIGDRHSVKRSQYDRDRENQWSRSQKRDLFCNLFCHQIFKNL